MSAPRSVTVFAPATVANVASGFDVLGFALERPGDAVTVRRTEGREVIVTSISGPTAEMTGMREA